MRRLAILLPLLLLPLTAQAGTREDVLSGSIRCSTIAEDRLWLECYYGAAQPMRRQLGLQPVPETQLRLVPQAGGGAQPAPVTASSSSSSSSSFVPTPPPRKGRDGLFYDVVGGKVLVSRMAATAYSFDRNGHFIITLSDGEVWQQSPGDTLLAKWNRPASDYLVTVREGAIGSIQLEVQGDSRIYKVKRIR
jgi:hypothetical protein